ncbi:MAG: 3-dehydroquinate synthase, partial [Casimicrobiaceae bacterium]
PLVSRSAIETGTGYSGWLHGEAVAAGMVLAARLSVRRGELAPEDCARLARLLARAQLPVDAPALGFERYRELMGRDKKVLAGTMRFILLRGIGAAYVASDVAAEDLASILP